MGAGLVPSLVPLSFGELCAHALELKCSAALQSTAYARRLHELRAERVAAAFEDLAREQHAEIHALEAVCGARPSAELSPWEYVWRLSYMPEALGSKPQPVPRNAREALQLAISTRHRAESFYNDVAASSAEGSVRNCAAELAGGERWRLKRLEELLQEEKPAD